MLRAALVARGDHGNIRDWPAGPAAGQAGAGGAGWHRRGGRRIPGLGPDRLFHQVPVLADGAGDGVRRCHRRGAGGWRCPVAWPGGDLRRAGRARLRPGQFGGRGPGAARSRDSGQRGHGTPRSGAARLSVGGRGHWLRLLGARSGVRLPDRDGGACLAAASPRRTAAGGRPAVRPVATGRRHRARRGGRPAVRPAATDGRNRARWAAGQQLFFAPPPEFPATGTDPAADPATGTGPAGPPPPAPAG